MQRRQFLFVTFQVEFAVALILHAGVEQRGVLLADRNRLCILNSVDEDLIAEDVAVKGEEESVARAFQPLEQIGPAEAFQPFPSARQILEDLQVCRGEVRRQRLLLVATQTVAWKLESIDDIDDLFLEEPRARIIGIVRIGIELYRVRLAIGKVSANAIRQGQVVTSIAFVALRVVRDDERTSATHEEETHYFAPVVGISALFERR